MMSKQGQAFDPVQLAHQHKTSVNRMRWAVELGYFYYGQDKRLHTLTTKQPTFSDAVAICKAEAKYVRAPKEAKVKKLPEPVAGLEFNGTAQVGTVKMMAIRAEVLQELADRYVQSLTFREVGDWLAGLNLHGILESGEMDLIF
jgi:hypothetical protein